MSISSIPPRERILEAALAHFARHGFRRASMVDLAREAGVSRPALYLHFGGKAQLLVAVAGKVKDDALAAAEAAWRGDLPLADNLAAAFLAKDLPLYRLLRTSPAGEELMAADSELTRAMAEALDEGLAAQLQARFSTCLADGSAALGPFLNAPAFGLFAARAAAGLKSEARDEADLIALATTLARVLAATCTPRAAP